MAHEEAFRELFECGFQLEKVVDTETNLSAMEFGCLRIIEAGFEIACSFSFYLY